MQICERLWLLVGCQIEEDKMLQVILQKILVSIGGKFLSISFLFLKKNKFGFSNIVRYGAVWFESILVCSFIYHILSIVLDF
jgi:hypothetical protein